MLVSITAHELSHIEQYVRALSRRRGLERYTEAQALRVLNAFRESRKKLLEDWSKEPVSIKRLKVSRQVLRAKAVEKALMAWRIKLKLAQAKVRKYQKQAKYYEPVLAAIQGEDTHD